MKLTLALFFAIFSICCSAADTGNLITCKADLDNLVIPKFKTSYEKSMLHTSLEEYQEGRYTIKVYFEKVPFDPGTPNTTATAGWLKLDPKNNVVYDFSYDDKDTEKLNLSADQVRGYVQKCLESDHSQRKATDAIVITNLPFRLDSFEDCFDNGVSARKCEDRYHEYPVAWLPSEMRDQIPKTMLTYVPLPKFSNVDVFLTTGTSEHITTFTWNAFINGKPASQQVIGQFDQDNLLTFDISKDYLITTYLRAGPHTSDKIKKVEHWRLGEDGHLTLCPLSNPACK